MTTGSENIGILIKQRRNMIRLTLSQLSAKSGVSPSYLGRVEKGERFPSARILRRIADPLEFAERELFAFAGYLSPQSYDVVKRASQVDLLEPNVARALSQEPFEVQRAMFSIFSALKYIATGTAEENSGDGGASTHAGFRNKRIH